MLLAEIKVSYSVRQKKSELQKISSCSDCHRILRQIWSADTIELYEEAYVLCLDRAGRVLGYSKVGQGGISGCLIDPKIVFSIALQAGASAIVLAHNHPSGTLTPSRQDVALTARIKECGKVLDIDLFDHIIMTADSYFSFADASMM